MRILITYRSLFELSIFSHTLLKNDHTVIFSDQSRDIQTLLDAKAVDVVIGHDRDLDMIKDLITNFPMIHYAVISSLGKESFHERTEGYGVLMRLQSPPEKTDADDLLEKLHQLEILTAA